VVACRWQAEHYPLTMTGEGEWRGQRALAEHEFAIRQMDVGIKRTGGRASMSNARTS